MIVSIIIYIVFHKSHTILFKIQQENTAIFDLSNIISIDIKHALLLMPSKIFEEPKEDARSQKRKRATS